MCNVYTDCVSCQAITGDWQMLFGQTLLFGVDCFSSACVQAWSYFTLNFTLMASAILSHTMFVLFSLLFAQRVKISCSSSHSVICPHCHSFQALGWECFESQADHSFRAPRVAQL
eukprot:scpid97604/ scgid15908/ 